MPNWCNNFATIRNEDPAKIKALADAFNEGKFCNAVIPVPKELTDTVSGFLGDDYAQELNEFKQKLNVKYFGAKDWYDFCTSRWGTKWDVGGDGMVAEIDDDGRMMTISFDSAWAPPMGIYEQLVEDGYEVDAMYYEPGMAYCGRFVDGYDNHCDFGSMTADEVADAIDADIDECFGITESMREYEEQERMDEELYRFVKEGAEKTAELKTL